MDKIIKYELFNIISKLRDISNHEIPLQFSKLLKYLDQTHNIIVDIQKTKNNPKGLLIMKNYNLDKPKDIKFYITINPEIDDKNFNYYLSYIIGTIFQIININIINKDNEFQKKFKNELISINEPQIKAMIFSDIYNFKNSQWFADRLLVPEWLFIKLNNYYKNQNKIQDLSTLSNFFNVPSDCILRRYDKIKTQMNLNNITNNLVF